MKKASIIASLALAVSSSLSLAQEESPELNFSYNAIFNQSESNSQFSALGGVTQIGDQTYAGFRFQPEIAIKKFGVGLDVPILVNVNDGSLRTEEFRGGTGPLKLIRYVRYGVKGQDPVYVRLGDITGTYLGYGGLVNNYSNSASYERRKIGIAWDVLVKKKYGIEGFYSDLEFTSPNLFGVRPYVRPLMDVVEIPIVKTMEVGFTYVQDKDNTKTQYEDNGTAQQSDFLDKTQRAWGADIGFNIINTKIIRVKTFAQYSKLAENKSIAAAVAQNPSLKYSPGHGKSVGAMAILGIGGDFLQLNTRLERLWYSDHYLPQFFDAVYEINKDEKLTSLVSARSQQGVYGSLTGIFLSKVRLGGALLLPDNVTDESPAYLRLDASLIDLFDKLNVSATYMKGGISDLSDALKIDDRSLLNARIAYRVAKFIVAGVDYRWTFAKQEDGKVEATSHVMPYFGLNVPFGQNQK